MAFGKNLQTLRKKTGITQEKLAERMNVSRQTISNWEADVYPEMDKLLILCDIFSCKLDELIRGDLSAAAEYYSPVRVETVKGFRLARYVMISPNPEDDVQTYMRRWADHSSLAATGEELKMIGWDFPFVSYEQQQRATSCRKASNPPAMVWRSIPSRTKPTPSLPSPTRMWLPSTASRVPTS